MGMRNGDAGESNGGLEVVYGCKVRELRGISRDVGVGVGCDGRGYGGKVAGKMMGRRHLGEEGVLAEMAWGSGGRSVPRTL